MKFISHIPIPILVILPLLIIMVSITIIRNYEDILFISIILLLSAFLILLMIFYYTRLDKFFIEGREIGIISGKTITKYQISKIIDIKKINIIQEFFCIIKNKIIYHDTYTFSPTYIQITIIKNQDKGVLLLPIFKGNKFIKEINRKRNI